MTRRIASSSFYYLLIVFILVLTSSSKHKFYVSISQVDINTSTNSLEITIKAFAHDIEDAILQENHIKLSLGNSEQDSLSTEEIRKYLSGRVVVKQSDTLLPLKLIGFELETDVIWLYLEAKYLPDNNELSIRNSLIMELFEDQKNIINIRQEGVTKSWICTKSHPEYSFKI